MDSVEDFDWVAARCTCSPEAVFEKLKSQVESDVQKRDSALAKAQRERYRFEFVPDRNFFSVIVSGNRIHGSVKFGLTDTGIVVLDEQGTTILVADATINDDGECRLTVSGSEKELWQVRKMALEKLFFAKY